MPEARMLGYVANTDQHWFELLRQQPPQEEVNFWSPSDFYTFRGQIGSPFFFRLKSPVNAIAGFGVVAWADKMPEWLAWECFGVANGAPSLEDLRSKVQRLRDKTKIVGRDTLDQIGCIILSRPVFFPRELWIAQPNDWKPQNLRYTGYDLTEGEGLRIWRECTARSEGSLADTVPASVAEGDRFGPPVLIHPRLGQGTFRLAVTAAYDRACAVTKEHSLPALVAAHIKPYGRDGKHEVSNGLLLRSDLHRLFDRGYLTVTPDHRLEVSGRLRDHFSNGKSYYPLHGSEVAVPTRTADHPDPALLQWHNEHAFQG